MKTKFNFYSIILYMLLIISCLFNGITIKIGQNLNINIGLIVYSFTFLFTALLFSSFACLPRVSSYVFLFLLKCYHSHITLCFRVYQTLNKISIELMYFMVFICKLHKKKSTELNSIDFLFYLNNIFNIMLLL